MCGCMTEGGEWDGTKPKVTQLQEGEVDAINSGAYQSHRRSVHLGRENDEPATAAPRPLSSMHTRRRLKSECVCVCVCVCGT
jgi:hypothetical protein